MSFETSALWGLRDESNYRFLEKKYEDRQKLAGAADDARKLAAKSQTIDGKPNPLHPMLELKAEMAQMRFEMAYMVEHNAHLASYLETLEYLHQRVSICEGAYAHTKMLAESHRIDYSMIQRALKFIEAFKQEHSNDTGKTQGTARPAG